MLCTSISSTSSSPWMAELVARLISFFRLRDGVVWCCKFALSAAQAAAMVPQRTKPKAQSMRVCSRRSDVPRSARTITRPLLPRQPSRLAC